METPLEYILTHTYKDEMMRYMAENPQDFEEAIALAVSDKQPYAWRAAWLLWSCIEKNDPRILPRLDDIIKSLDKKADGHIRELLKIIELMELNEEQEGVLLNLCLNLWESTRKRPSIRYIAIKLIFRLSQKYPELAQEIAFITQGRYMDELTPGIKRGVEKLIIKHNIKLSVILRAQTFEKPHKAGMTRHSE